MIDEPCASTYENAATAALETDRIRSPRTISLGDFIPSLPLHEQIAIEREVQRKLAEIDARKRRKNALKRTKRVKDRAMVPNKSLSRVIEGVSVKKVARAGKGRTATPAIPLVDLVNALPTHLRDALIEETCRAYARYVASKRRSAIRRTEKSRMR